MKTAEEIFKDIKEMESGESYKLIRDVIKYTKKDDEKQSEFLIELIEEVTKIKQDIEFIANKLGLHDMYIDRLTKQIEKKFFDKD